MGVKIPGIRHCHAMGVDSVILGEEGGRLRRAFIAHPEHELWSRDNLPVGFHPHHCEIRIKVLEGELLHLTVTARDSLRLQEGEMAIVAQAYLYHSPIGTEGRGSFEDLHTMALLNVAPSILRPGDCVELPAATMHTILLEKEKGAIWVVTEGEEDPNYQPITYSTRDLTAETMEGMYLPMTETEVAASAARVVAAERTVADTR